MADYNEIFLESMQTLIDASLRQLPMDETVVCSIVDVSEREQGHYKVSPDGAVVYDAYSDKTTYSTKDQVVVLIPKDDTVKRTIISRYVSNTTERPLAYVSEAEKIIKATGDLIEDTENRYCLIANGNVGVKEISEIDLSGLSEQQILSDTIYLAADFQTLFTNDQQVNMRSGNYGLMLLAYKEDILVGQWVLDSSMMFGNPYAFVVPFRQEIALHYGDLIFDKLELNFYQQKNFTYFDGTTGNIEVEQGLENLFVSNIELFLSWDIESVEDNTVKIYTTDNLGYNFDPTAETRAKTVSLIFYNKDENNKYIGFTDGSFNEIEAQRIRAKIKNILGDNTQGYRYYLEGVTGNCFTEEKLKDSDEKEYQIGDLVYYTNEVEGNIPTLKILTDKVATTNSYWIKWYANNNNGAIDEVRNKDEATDEESKDYETIDEVPEKNRDTIVIPCRNNLLKTQVYAIVYCNGEQYKSNTLEFENKGDLARNILSLQGINVVLEHGKNSQEAYALYDGITNSLLNPSEAGRARQIRFNWTTNPGYAIEPAFWKESIVTWYMPVAGTMLAPPRNSGWVTADNSPWYIYTQEVDDIANIFCEYSISSNYLANCRNNTIRCVVKVPLTGEGENIVYGTLEGSISMGFSAFGNSGTDYTIVFTEEFTEEGKQVKAKVVDKNNSKQDNTTVYMKWKWKDDWSSDPIDIEGINYTTYNLIEAKAEVKHSNMDVWIYNYYAVITRKNDNYNVTIPGSIIYDSTGTNPIYYKGNLEYTGIKLDQEQPKWWICYYDTDGKKAGYWLGQFQRYNTSFNGLPYLERNENSVQKLIVPNFYTQTMRIKNDEDKWVTLQYISFQLWSQDGTTCYIDYPVYIGQNQHESALLNNWDGALQVDTEGNYILSAMMGAGHKDYENTFTGVIMGDYGKLDGNIWQNYKTGLFGFSQGVQTFELNTTDGKLILGAAGAGQIEFDGNNGIIKSSTWDKNNTETGSYWDLANGEFRLQADSSYLRFTDDNGLEIKTKAANFTLVDDGGQESNISSLIMTPDQIKLLVSEENTKAIPCQGNFDYDHEIEGYKANLWNIQPLNSSYHINNDDTIAVTFQQDSYGWYGGSDAVYWLQFKIAENDTPRYVVNKQDEWVGGGSYSSTLTWKAGNVLYFQQTTKITEEGEYSVWKNIDPPTTSIYSAIDQKASAISAVVQGDTSGASWSLTDSGFYVNAGRGGASANNYVMAVNSQGLDVRGKLTAQVGSQIGNWGVSANGALYTTDNNYGIAFYPEDVGTTSRCVGIGKGLTSNNVDGSWPRDLAFSIDGQGAVTCTNLTVNGGTINSSTFTSLRTNDGKIYFGDEGGTTNNYLKYNATNSTLDWQGLTFFANTLKCTSLDVIAINGQAMGTAPAASWIQIDPKTWALGYKTS